MRGRETRKAYNGKMAVPRQDPNPSPPPLHGDDSDIESSLSRYFEKNEQKNAAAQSLGLDGDSGKRAGEPRHGQRETRQRAVALCFELVAQGKTRALGDLYDLTASDLFGYIMSILGSLSDSEDVFQEVFVKVAGRGAKLVRVEKPLAYMFAIARNEAFNFLNKRAKTHSAGEFDMLLEMPARESAPPELTADEAGKALARLPASQREAIVLKIYEGFTFGEIAEITGISANTAASRYRYGLVKLAGILKRTLKDHHL